MLTFLRCSNFEKKLDMVISHLYFISKNHAKCKFALKVIQFITNSNLFPLEHTDWQYGQTLCIAGKLDW